MRTSGTTDRSMKKKVIAAGHICLDITPVFQDRQVSGIADVIKPGKLVEVGAADVHTGGSVANTGLAMQFLGADVTLIGKIGRDSFGSMILNILDQYGTAYRMISSDTESTSYSIVLAVPGIDRTFIHNPGANDAFGPEDVPEEELSDAALFHFGYPPQMRRMYEDGGRGLTALMEHVHRAGIVTSLDLAAVDPASQAGQQDWVQILKNTLPHIDIFVPSIEELCYMLDHERYDAWQERAAGRDVTKDLSIDEDIIPLAKKCLDMGVKITLLKCGLKGMYCCAAGKDALSGLAGIIGIDPEKWGGFSHFEGSYKADRILSATGAGDASIAAFLTAMINGETPEDVMHLAAGTGASCVEAYDALSGLKDFETLQAKIAAGWEKNPTN